MSSAIPRQANHVTRLPSTRLVVALGLVSYSPYLWRLGCLLVPGGARLRLRQLASLVGARRLVAHLWHLEASFHLYGGGTSAWIGNTGRSTSTTAVAGVTTLNSYCEAGEAGWELVALAPHNVAYLKRAVERASTVRTKNNATLRSSGNTAIPQPPRPGQAADRCR